MVVVWEQEPKAKVEQTRSEKVGFINGVMLCGKCSYVNHA